MKSPISKGAPAPSSSSAPPHRRLRRADLPPETLELARFLIGKLLIRRLDDGTLLSGRIVETEAYGIDDPASHAYRGETKRNRAMFEPHAHLYVYLIYGTSYCVNVSTEARGIGAAVLIRAIEPLTGLDRMRASAGATGCATTNSRAARATSAGPSASGRHSTGSTSMPTTASRSPTTAPRRRSGPACGSV